MWVKPRVFSSISNELNIIAAIFRKKKTYNVASNAGMQLIKKVCSRGHHKLCTKMIRYLTFRSLAKTPNFLNILSHKRYFCLVTCRPILASSSKASLSCVWGWVGEWGITGSETDACQISIRRWPSAHVALCLKIQFVYGIVGEFERQSHSPEPTIVC